MAWDGEERRIGKERRVIERRRSLRYNVDTLLIVEGVTWIDAEKMERRKRIRRLTDRERLAQMILQICRP